MKNILASIVDSPYQAIGCTSRRVLALSLIFSLMGGCAYAPGMTSGSIENYSNTGFQDESGQVKKIVVKEINAKSVAGIKNFSSQSNSLSGYNELSSGISDSYSYRLGVGDIISVTVWDHPELTIPEGQFRSGAESGNRIAEDGTIFYPYAGKVVVEGKTLSEVRELLTQKLGQYIENLQLDVRIAAFRSKRIYVVGEVNTPGIRQITDLRPTVIEMINQSGGFSANADKRLITLTRGSNTYNIDLQSLYENGDSSQNIMMEPGDVLNIADSSKNKVFVLGEVNEPGSYPMSNGRKTLAEAIGEAGGVAQTTSNPGQIYVMRGGTESPEIFHLDASSPDALLLADSFPLESHDVVYIDAAKVVRWNRLLGNLNSTVSILTNATR